MNSSHSGGHVIWITGLSGAGKSTIARLLTEKLRMQKVLPVLLDGDAIRRAIRDTNCGHDLESRLANAYRISRIAKLIADQGHLVIVATMSLFHEIQNWNRQNMTRYFEVFLDVSMETVKDRDPKKIYDSVNRGNECNVPGVDLVPQFPLKPELHINNNTGPESLDSIVKNILDRFLKSSI